MIKRMKLMAMTSMMALAGGMAAAQVTLPAGEVTRPAIEQAFSAYEYIEIKYGLTQVKVEAVDNDTLQKIEVIYDRATGAVLKSEIEAAGDDAGRSGVVVKSLTRDFVDNGDDDSSGDDDNTSGDDDNTSGDDDNTSGDDDDTSGDDD